MDVKVKYKFKELEWSVNSSHQLTIKVSYKIPGRFFPVVIEEEAYWGVKEESSLRHLSRFVKDQKFRRDFILDILHKHFEKEEKGLEINAVLSGALELFSKKRESFSFNDVELGLVRKEEDNQDENI